MELNLNKIYFMEQQRMHDFWECKKREKQKKIEKEEKSTINQSLVNGFTIGQNISVNNKSGTKKKQRGAVLNNQK